MRFIYQVLLSLLLITSSASLYAMTLTIKGVKGALLDNIEARLSVIPPDEVANNIAFRKYVSQEVLKATQALGYYQPVIQFSTSEQNKNNQLILNITPGEATKIAAVNVNLKGAGAQDPELIKLVNANKPNIGDILNQGKFDDFKSNLYDLAITRGYFSNKFTQHQLVVAPSLHQAFWDIVFDTGPRYRFGSITYVNSNIQTNYLNNLSPFKEGSHYQSGSLATFNNALSSSNWFKSVLVTPEVNKATPDHQVPILVQLTPQAKNLVDLGLGYSSDVGLNSTINWTRPWVNAKGQSFSSSTYVAAKQQKLSLSYKIPLEKAPLTQYYVIQSGYKRENNNDTRTNSYSLDLARYWQFKNGWQQIAGVKTSYDDFTQGDQHNKTLLIYPTLAYSKTQQTGGLMPNSAVSQNYSVMISSRAWLSNINFVIFNARNSWITTFAKRNRLIFRTQFGWISTNNFSKVPPSLRFFAGGDRSVRGYAYKSISPRDQKGQLLGASRLATASLEYQYNVAGAWWGAAFIDTGEAVNSFKHNNFKTGAGVGIRWDSIVGPVRFDVAKPLGHNAPDKFYFYFGIGAEL